MSEFKATYGDGTPVDLGDTSLPPVKQSAPSPMRDGVGLSYIIQQTVGAPNHLRVVIRRAIQDDVRILATRTEWKEFMGDLEHAISHPPTRLPGKAFELEFDLDN